MKKGLVLSAVSAVLLSVLTAVFSGQRQLGGIGIVEVSGPTHLPPGETGTFAAVASSDQTLKTPINWEVYTSGRLPLTFQSNTLSTTFTLNFGSSTGDRYVVVEATTGDNKFIGY